MSTHAPVQSGCLASIKLPMWYKAAMSCQAQHACRVCRQVSQRFASNVRNRLAAGLQACGPAEFLIVRCPPAGGRSRSGSATTRGRRRRSAPGGPRSTPPPACPRRTCWPRPRWAAATSCCSPPPRGPPSSWSSRPGCGQRHTAAHGAAGLHARSGRTVWQTV